MASTFHLATGEVQATPPTPETRPKFHPVLGYATQEGES